MSAFVSFLSFLRRVSRVSPRALVVLVAILAATFGLGPLAPLGVARASTPAEIPSAVPLEAPPLTPPPRADRAGDEKGGRGPVATPPLDVPLVFQASALRIPEVPASYQRRDLGWLRVAFAPAARERLQPLLTAADDFRTKLESELGQSVLDHVDVRVARTPEEMATLAPEGAPPPEYASGVAYPALHLVLLTLTAPRSAEAVDVDEVLRHELAHVALEDAVAGHHVPRWFNEGLAVHESGEIAAARTRTLWDATLSRTVLPLADLDRGFPNDHYEVSIAYAESADFVRFLLRSADRDRFAALIARVRGGQAFDGALGDAYGTDVRKLEYQWREDIAKRYSFIPVLTGGSLLWVIGMVVLVVGYVKRRRRAKATLERWGREEAAFDAAMRSALKAPTPQVAPLPPATSPSQAPPMAAALSGAMAELPKVEHDGSWHTLH